MFAVGSLPCSERLLSGYSGFPLSSKTNISNSNSIWNCQALKHEPLAWVIALCLTLNLNLQFAPSKVNLGSELHKLYASLYSDSSLLENGSKQPRVSIHGNFSAGRGGGGQTSWK